MKSNCNILLHRKNEKFKSIAHEAISDCLKRIFESHVGINLEMRTLVNSSDQVLVTRIFQESEETENYIESSQHDQDIREDYIPLDIQSAPGTQLLTSKGALLEMCSDQICPQAKFVSQTINGHIRIYSIRRDLKDLSRGLTIRGKSTFSIFSEKLPSTESEDVWSFKEAELLIIAARIMHTFKKYLPGAGIIALSHTYLIDVLANELELVDPEEYKRLIDVMADPELSDLDREESDLWKLCKENSKLHQKAQKFLSVSCSSFSEFEERFIAIFGKKNALLNKALNNLRCIDAIVQTFISSLDKPNISLEYCICHQTFSKLTFHSGLVFSILSQKVSSPEAYSRKKSDFTLIELAYGGRFDNQVQSFRVAETKSSSIFACGLVLRNHELFNFVAKHVEKHDHPQVDIDIFNGTSVMVASYGQELMLLEKYRLACEFWKNNIKTQVIIPPVAQGNRFDDLKRDGIQFVVIVKPWQKDSFQLRSLKTGKTHEDSIDKIIEKILGKQLTYEPLGSKKDLIESILK